MFGHWLTQVADYGPVLVFPANEQKFGVTPAVSPAHTSLWNGDLNTSMWTSLDLTLNVVGSYCAY